MKKILLPVVTLFVATLGFSQQRNQLSPYQGIPLKVKSLPDANQPKTLLCNDTLRYPQAKEQILGTSNFYTGFGVWQADNESVSMAFLNSGSLNITGVEFYGARSTSGAASVTVNCAVYNVNASYTPTTLVGSGNVTITATTYGYRYATLATPVTVTGNYAIVLKPTNSGGILNLVINDETQGQPYDELFAKFFSAYTGYPNPNVWNTIPVFSPGYNYEPIIAPIVNYSINTAYTASATTVCQGIPITYTNATTPMGVLSSRMNNYSVFRTYFGTAASDSTFVYDMDNLSPYIWSGTTTYTHPAAGTYDVLLATNGGFWSSCFDYTTQTITVNPTPATPTITPSGPTTFCAGGSVTLTSSAASGNTWSAGQTTQSINVTSAGTFTVTTTSLGCSSPASSPITVTVNPLDNANFTYASNTICQSAPNTTPSINSTGAFTSTPAGLSIVNAATGEINAGASATGSYTVTFTTSGTCPNTSNQTITISTAQDASFNYAAPSYCTNGANPSPVFGMGASAGTFSSSAGLFINSGTGEVNLAASTPGTYTVTNTIPASGGCAADTKTANITINATPTATISGGGSICGTGSATVSIALTGAGPWDITYTDGVTPTTINGVTGNPHTFTTSTAGTYTVTNVTMGACSSAGTGTATVTVNANPTVTFTAVSDMCESASAVNLVASPAGGTFSGSTGVSGSTFTPTGLSGSITLTYNYTDGNGCSGSANTTFTVNTNPTVSLSAFNDVCSNVSPFALTGGTPAGGTYSGPGVTGGNFDPSAASTGSNAITYTFVDGNGCSGSSVSSITVNDCAGLSDLSVYGLTVYPNPASTTLVVKSGKALTFTMTSEDGKIVIPTTSVVEGIELNVNTASFARGMYYIHFNGENGAVVQKVILQ